MTNREGLVGELSRVGADAFIKSTRRFKTMGFALLWTLVGYAASVFWLYFEVKPQIENMTSEGRAYNKFITVIACITAWRSPDAIHRNIDFLGACIPALILTVPILVFLGIAAERSRMFSLLSTKDKGQAAGEKG
jgi:hypothetical protein